MKDYINTWLHGEETTQRTQQISARVENHTVAYIEQLMSTFGISKTEAIQGALDTGLKQLLSEAALIFSKDICPDAKAQHDEGKNDYLDAKAEHEKNNF